MNIMEHADLVFRPFTSGRAREVGVSRGALRLWCSEGSLVRMLVDVYISSTVPETIELRAEALRLVVPAHVVICDRTAAWLHGIDALDLDELREVPRIETCVPPDCSRIRRPQARGATRELLPSDVQTIDGLCVTTPLRTALDLGRSLWPHRALGVLDWYLRLEEFTPADLLEQLPRFRGRRGVVQLRKLVAMANSASESPGESWIRLIMHDAGLPAPELQFRILVDGIERYRLDLAYSKFKICIEYDGVRFHDDPAQRARDEARRDWLRRQGWIVFVIRKEDLGQEQSLLWTNRVHEALAARGRSIDF